MLLILYKLSRVVWFRDESLHLFSHMNRVVKILLLDNTSTSAMFFLIISRHVRRESTPIFSHQNLHICFEINFFIIFILNAVDLYKLSIFSVMKKIFCRCGNNFQMKKSIFMFLFQNVDATEDSYNNYTRYTKCNQKIPFKQMFECM